MVMVWFDGEWRHFNHYGTSSLFSVIAVLARSSSVVTLARPPSSPCLKITDHFFRYASPCLWNQLFSLRQPHSASEVTTIWRYTNVYIIIIIRLIWPSRQLLRARKSIVSYHT